MASVVKRRAVLEPSKLNRDSQKAGVTMVRVVLSALVYAGKNQSPCLHEITAPACLSLPDKQKGTSPVSS